MDQCRRNMSKFQFALIFTLIWQSRADSSDPFLLQTQSLPSDLNFMPSLSNGHLGYTVFGDAIFMNGVYNGATGKSKRARIPNWININAEICDRFGCEQPTGISYEMNLRDGYFHYTKNYASIGITLEQRTYPHRYYNRALIYEVLATRHATSTFINSPRFLKLTQQPGNDSDAFDFVGINNGSDAVGDYRQLRGRTRIVELEQFQPQAHEIHVAFSESLEQPRQVPWPAWQAQLQHRVVISLDRVESVALNELQNVMRLSDAALLASHTKLWHEFWQQHFSIEITGNALELSRIVNAGIFYLVSSLPTLSSNQPNDPYYGLSPTGLARGNLEADYQGHNFWDTEIWMLPVATQFGYDYGKLLLEYRFRHLNGAQYNANATGYKGARFPWESAYTGTEVTNPCCPEVAQQEIHISPDISFALQKLFAQSQDYNWLCERAWPIVAEVADFLLSRASCEANACHFRQVMGPDEDHANIDDNVYTNAVSKIALDFAAWTADKCDSNTNNSARIANWQQLRDQLIILYDAQLDYHPQHLGYQLQAIVKQADTILLGYPLQFDTSSTHLNDLHYYANVTRESGPAMTWSMFAANYLGTAEFSRADEYFTRGYQNYVRPEFKVWSETPIGYDGSANFLTGIGGFLQALIFGYGGLNFARVNDTLQLQLTTANVPPNVQKLQVKYIQFADSKCSWQFSHENSTMNCSGPSTQHFELIQGNNYTQLGSNFTVTLNRGDLPLQIQLLNADKTPQA
ncbi:protein-glucosylgalactosylhydroxylysine glucosidase isoform X2 [Drosophila sulfurigaster albostrigata]|uniref:protein-glucosylgalactosylhydroxylysine glucosidase isoform X2 n=1 Tax=Drosophila sulfurigaster albostrigata TaxID=89887 RepID=UPI002D21DEFC|nr:protein-glucosylgalactosylhydroxylysine glucosidase isoform X2 [Drosophila sulfurigaster albostrigata]